MIHSLRLLILKATGCNGLKVSFAARGREKEKERQAAVGKSEKTYGYIDESGTGWMSGWMDWWKST